MSIASLLKISKDIIRKCSIVFSILQCVSLFALAENNDQDIFNRFYKEIVNSATVGKPQKGDSINSKTASGLIDHKLANSSANTSDEFSEKLKNEIEKNVKDFQLRHSDAVKFMQEEK